MVSAASTVPISGPSYKASPAKNKVCSIGVDNIFLASVVCKVE